MRRSIAPAGPCRRAAGTQRRSARTLICAPSSRVRTLGAVAGSPDGLSIVPITTWRLHRRRAFASAYLSLIAASTEVI